MSTLFSKCSAVITPRKVFVVSVTSGELFSTARPLASYQTRPPGDVRQIRHRSRVVATYLPAKRHHGSSMAATIAWIKDERLLPRSATCSRLERALEAYKLLEEGKNYGKLILKIA